VEKKVQAGEKVGYKAAVGAVRQLLEAVKIVHDKNVVHCDISPGNTLLRDNSLNEVVLSDFSAAENLNDTAQTPYTTASGTDGFASRRMRNNESRYEELYPADKHSDYYSLGAILLFLLSGEYPESSESIQWSGGRVPDSTLAEWRRSMEEKGGLTKEECDRAAGFIGLTMRDDMSVQSKEIFGYVF